MSAVNKNGSVSIDGEVVSDLKKQFSPENFEFSVLAKIINIEKNLYCSKKTSRFRVFSSSSASSKCFSLLPETMIHRGVQAVGRLDQDTTGLLLLTDDGKYLQALTHPRKHVPKVYHVTTYDFVTPEQIEMLTQGVNLHQEKGYLLPQM